MLDADLPGWEPLPVCSCHLHFLPRRAQSPMPPSKPLKPIPGPPVQCSGCPIRARALFQVVSDDYINHAAQYRKAQYSLPAKAHLYREGQHPDMAFTLFDGWIMLYRQARDGSRQGLRVALPGDFIGYQSVGTRGASHAAMAITPCTLCGFEHDDLHTMLHDQPQLAVQLADIQSRDMASCQNQMLGLGRKRAEGRVAYLMLDLFHRMRERGATDGNSMAFPLTQELIGDLTGLTVVHTNRVIQKLRSSGLIESGGRKLVIRDEASLSEIAEFVLD